MGTRREGGWTCQGLLIAPGNIIDLDLLLPLLPAAVGVSAPPPPHSSGVLPGHITRHCGTAWRLQHTVSSLTMHLAWAFFFTAAASHARTRTRTHTHTHTPAVLCFIMAVYSSSVRVCFAWIPTFTALCGK